MPSKAHRLGDFTGEAASSVRLRCSRTN